MLIEQSLYIVLRMARKLPKTMRKKNMTLQIKQIVINGILISEKEKDQIR